MSPNAVRPVAEYVVGARMQTVVSGFRVSDNLRFASQTAQRLGGTAIKPVETPAYRRGKYDRQAGMLSRYRALLFGTGGSWAVQHSIVDAMHVW